MRKQCRRKIYPKINPIEHAMMGAALLNADQLDGERDKELASIEAFRTGQATLKDWDNMVNVMNLAAHMAYRGIGPEVKPVCNAAHAHLMDAVARFERTKKMGLTGPGLHCMRELHEWHYLQRTSITGAQYKQHKKELADRIRSGAPEVIDVLEAFKK